MAEWPSPPFVFRKTKAGHGRNAQWMTAPLEENAQELPNYDYG
jgi:hypothetical protein